MAFRDQAFSLLIFKDPSLYNCDIFKFSSNIRKKSTLAKKGCLFLKKKKTTVPREKIQLVITRWCQEEKKKGIVTR